MPSVELKSITTFDTNAYIPDLPVTMNSCKSAVEVLMATSG